MDIDNVSGPYNVIRLEGKINKINKILYLFFDIHEQLEYQTECKEIDATDIKTYLLNNFKEASEKNKIIYDFFIEYHPIRDNYFKQTIGHKSGYIGEICKFIIHSYSYDNDNVIREKNKISDNLRIHYIDFRNIFISNKIQDILFNLTSVCRDISQLFNANILLSIIDSLQILKSFLIYTYDTFLGEKQFSEKELTLLGYTMDMYKSTEHKLVKKIIGRYNNKNVKNKLGLIIKNEFNYELIKHLNTLDKFISTIENFLKINNGLKDYDKILYCLDTDMYTYGGIDLHKINDIVNYINNEICMEIDFTIRAAIIYVMDIYFLRRYLDKDYITNGIAYTGGAHSINYIYLLVKYFDFKITNFSYVNTGFNMNLSDNIDIHDKIKQSNNYTEIAKYFSPSELYQCSNVSTFPKLFL